MHELAIAKGVVDRAAEAAREHGAEAVDGLTLAVGRATHLNPDQLRFCVQTIAEGTPVEGASITIEKVAVRARCDCGWTGEPDAVAEAIHYVPDPVCPVCSNRVELIRGQGCRLVRIDVPATDASTVESP